MRIKHAPYSILVAGLALAPAILLANPAQESVADAARKAQAAKKASTKPAMVLTNDNLDTLKGTISVVGPSPASAKDAPSDKMKPAATDDKAKADAGPDKKAPPKDEAAWRAIFASERRKLADDEHELDILQREFNLKEQQAYSDPNTAMREQYSRDDLNNTKKAIDDKSAAVAQEKQHISDLEDELRASGGQPGWSAAP